VLFQLGSKTCSHDMLILCHFPFVLPAWTEPSHEFSHPFVVVDHVKSVL